MIAKERFDAMGGVVEKLCKQDEKFRKVWEVRNALMGPGNHDHVNDEFADKTETWLRHELKAMESNELLDKEGKDKWDTPFQPRVHKATPEQPGQRNTGAGWNGAWEDRRNNFACYFASEAWFLQQEGLSILP